MQFKEVNYWNCDEIIDLKVKQFQKKFVASNMYSLAEVYGAVASKGNAVPFGIYLGDKPIGFIMFGYYPDEEYARKVFKECYLDFIPRSYLIWRFMIDNRYQGKGYGKEALKLALEYVKSRPLGEADCCWLSYELENEVAKKLYASLGFEEIPLPEGWDEIPAILKI